MPVRRQSASVSPGNVNVPPSASRHRGHGDPRHESYSSYDGGMTGSMDGGVGEQKVIMALVGRLVNKLPCNSGTRLSMMEADSGVRNTVDSLLQLSKIRLNLVIQGLAAALETLSKYSSSSSLPDTPLDTLHSQVYMLHVVHLCLSASWRSQALTQTPPPSGLPRCWPDPNPFDEHLARYLLGVTLIYARMVSIDFAPAPGTTSPAPSREKGAGTNSSSSWGVSIPLSSSTAVGSQFIQQRSYPASNSEPLPDENQRAELLSQSCTTTSTTVMEMTRVTSRIVFFLSASNWPLVHARLIARIGYLTTTIEETPDLVELRLLEWSNLNRTRLGQILQDVSSSFLHVKRPSQVTIAGVLRRAIWSWIEVYPIEYETLVESNRKIEGGPDVLFDVLHSASDNSSSSNARRTKAFYPLMAMLLVVCPDIFKRAVMGDMGGRGLGGLSKKLSFIESLRKGISSSKGFEASAVCYVDIVRAGLSLPPRLESAGVRSILPDIQNDLKNALFFSTLSGEISDTNLLVDGLVALYRINPINATALLFGKLFADSNEMNRIVAIRACATIIVESDRLPWHPPATDLRDKVAAAIRSVLRTQENSIVNEPSTPRRPRATPDLPSNQHDVTLEILRLYALDPRFAFAATSETTLDTMSNLLLTVSSLLIAPSPDTVRAAAARTTVALLDGLHRETSPISSCGNAIWQTFLDASRQGLHAFQSDSGDFNPAFSAFRDVSMAVASFAETHADLLSNAPRGESAALIGLVTIVTVLVSPDFEQLTKCSPAFKTLTTLTSVAHRAQLPGESPAGTNFGDPETRLKMRTLLFDALAKLPPATGRQQQQRQFRKVYKPFCFPSTAGVAIWLGLSAVSRRLTGKILAADASSLSRESRKRGLAPDIDGLNEGQSKLWQNITLFLASTAGLCQYDTSPPPAIVDCLGKGSLPRVYEESSDPVVACDSFVRECVDLLYCSSIHVRETVKEALGTELPVNLSRTMVSRMTKRLSRAMGPAGISTSETMTTFVDQVLSILRLITDRMSPAERAGAMQVDFGEIVSLMLRYVNRLHRDETTSRLKIKFSQLCEAVLAKGECIMLSNEGSLRNTILECLMEWSIEAQRDLEGHHNGYDSSIRLSRELDQSSLRAMIPITEGLTLKAAGEDSEATQSSVTSRIFYRHYAHLVKILERSHLQDEESLLAPSLSGQTGKNAPTEDSSGLAILVLSNLLSANIDVGLKHCLTLGYHEEPNIRTAFMRLLANILQSGARFGGLTTRRFSSAPKAYHEALAGHSANLALAVAICEACPPNEIDEMSLLLFRVFEAKGTCLSLVKMLAEREVALTNHESELFRANSFTTRILTIFAKTYGYNYVRATIQPLVHSLVEKPAECSFELDPSKAGPTDDIERNADHLQLMCQALLDLICSSTPRAPVMFRALCRHLWEVVEDRFPESRHSVIGSFIFLRFFCPAIVAPENIDLDVSPDTREIRRGLLLITKVIQNLANNVVFGNKEPHMKVLNTFLSENILQVTKFLSDLAVRPKSWELTAMAKVYQDDAERVQDNDWDEAILHRFMFKHQAKIESSLANLPPTFRRALNGAKAARVDLEGKATLLHLRGIMESTGSPADVLKLTSPARSQAYDEFMRHNSGRNVESVASAFYEGPASQNGRRIFYFIVSRVALVDYNLFAYHVFSILDKITDFFDLVIDLTDFSASTELPMAWLRRSIQMCPPGILPCINTLALYNPNTYARRRVRRIISDLLTIAPPVGKTIIAASKPEELTEFIPYTTLDLPEYTLALAYDSDHVWTNVLYFSDHEHQVPVVVKMGPDCLQIASWKRQDLTSTVKSYIIDVIRLKDIDDIILGGPMHPDYYFVIKHSQNESAAFISRKRNEIAQAIRTARSRLRDGPSDERILRPSDVPGTLLNAALMNLSSGDEALRLGAYNLINELCQFFKFDMVLSVLKVSGGLIIPSNSLAFAFYLSQALASSAPHLTLEFLKEWSIAFARADMSQKSASLYYVAPWLVNLEIFAKPSREVGVQAVKLVEEVVRTLVSLTVGERRRLYLSVQEHIWARLANCHEALVNVVVNEVLRVAVEAGLGSEKAEVAADILLSLASTSVRGRVIGRLRKTIAQTYLNLSDSLIDNVLWGEISVLTRITLMLTFNPHSSLDAQLFLPETFHIITLLVSTGPLLMRQTVYGVTVNIVQALTSATTSGDMDSTALHQLFKRLQQPEMVAAFGLAQSPHSAELVGALQRHDSDEALLANVLEVTKYLSEVLEAGSISIDCANAWRARWMGLVAATCFQRNPATQPQAFTVLGYLASDEVDDDLVYQLLVALRALLTHFTDGDNALLVSILRCMSKIIPGLGPDSRYTSCLFWIAVGILQLGYIPPFAAALEVMLTALRAMTTYNKGPLVMVLMEGRMGAGEPARRLDQLSGVSFETDVCFSLVAVVFKGVRHPSTRKLAMETMRELLRLSVTSDRDKVVDGAKKMVGEYSVAFFMALLPLMAGSTEDLKTLYDLAGVEVEKAAIEDVSKLSVFDLLSLPDNSTALLAVTLVVTILNTASSESEKIILYRVLADASVEMPEVVSMTYDSLIPRMTAVLSTTSTVPILTSITSILERAMADTDYSFPQSSLIASESTSSLQHKKSYSASISSARSAAGLGAREQVLEDLGMKGLGELSFTGVKMDRVSPMAQWVAALVDSFTL